MKSDNESHGGFGGAVGEILGELIHIFPGTFALLLRVLSVGVRDLS
jgi:hypothetical protein